MKQSSFFDQEDQVLVPTGLGIPGSQPILNKEQKLFNKLVAQIEMQRRLLQQWRDYGLVYQQRFTDEIQPLVRRIRDARIEMAALLDRAFDSRELGKRQRDKLRDILLAQLSDLIENAEDDELADLAQLYDKHSDTTFEAHQRQDMETAQAMAREMFGADFDAGAADASPEAFAEMLRQKMQEAQAAAHDEPPPRANPRKPSAKAAAAQATRERAEQDASQAIREVYRKLVSDLHPDREPDADERARKTALMQRVNQAYEARDLLALLEVQLAIEQLDPAALAGMARERIARYNRVLKEQSQRLQQELADVMAPFLQMTRQRNLTPDDVQRGLNLELAEMKAELRQLKEDLVSFRDIRVLKEVIRSYRVGQAADDELDMLIKELAMATPRRRRRKS